MIRIIIVILYLSQPVMAQTMVMVFLHQNDDKTLVPPAQLSKLINGHKIFMQKLSNEGKLLASGSFEGGGGIFIFKSNSADEVAEWLKQAAQRYSREELRAYALPARIHGLA